MENLFGIKVQSERYLQLWVIIAGIFNTWFFLSGVPENLEELEHETAYPKGLKVFTQYVLIPLVTVYVLILYAYLMKIVVAWDWPRDWVANLVLGFSITGIFSLLLVFPIRDRKENLWIKRFSKWYYIAEIPLVTVLLLAVLRRVNEYGITENRFFVLGLGLRRTSFASPPGTQPSGRAYQQRQPDRQNTPTGHQGGGYVHECYIPSGFCVGGLAGWITGRRNPSCPRTGFSSWSIDHWLRRLPQDDIVERCRHRSAIQSYTHQVSSEGTAHRRPLPPVSCDSPLRWRIHRLP